VEFSTKYEQQDRYLTRAEADQIAGRADIDDALESLARDVNRVVTERAEAAGFVHEDGKIECLYTDGELRVADVVGTFDENRFSYGDGDLEGGRPPVVQGERPRVGRGRDRAKTAVADRDIDDWRELCERDPEPLPQAVVDAVSELYAAGTNAYTDREWFDVPDIEAALDTVDGL